MLAFEINNTYLHVIYFRGERVVPCTCNFLSNIHNNEVHKLFFLRINVTIGLEFAIMINMKQQNSET